MLIRDGIKYIKYSSIYYDHNSLPDGNGMKPLRYKRSDNIVPGEWVDNIFYANNGYLLRVEDGILYRSALKLEVIRNEFAYYP